jgi:hypothetical protein
VCSFVLVSTLLGNGADAYHDSHVHLDLNVDT